MFKIGDKVVSKRLGTGIITDIKNDILFPIEVKFQNGNYEFFTETGTYYTDGHCPEFNISLVESKQEEPKTEMVDHPSHYQSGKFEVIDVIEEFNLGFNLGNVIKYILRSDKKFEGSEMFQDLKKAKWYLEREISKLEKNNVEKEEV